MVLDARLLPLEPNPSAILFDLDDTLCDYASARACRLRIAFRETGHPEILALSDEQLADLVAESITTQPHGVDHLPRLLSRFGVTATEAERAMAWYRRNRYHGLSLFPDAHEVIAAVRTGPNGASRTVGIITNGPSDVQRAKIELLGVDRLVDFFVISGEFGAAKPDPSIFREALRHAGATPAEAVFVGDAPEFDIAGAAAVGMRSVWVNRSGRGWEHPGSAPDRVIRSLRELPLLLAP